MARVAGLVASSLLLVASCGWGGDRAEATWALAPGQAVTAATTSLEVLVSRLGCNGGVTGEVNSPSVEVEDKRVVVTFTVSPGAPAAADCPGNVPVSYTLRLDRPLGDRELFDGSCAQGEAAGTSFCDPDGFRRTARDGRP